MKRDACVTTVGSAEGEEFNITTLIILGSSAIGGSWFPLFLVPEWVQKEA